MDAVHARSPRKKRLHIGAISAIPGWETLNAQPLPGIDHVGDAADLSRFPDNTFAEVYASHVLEHFDYKDVVLAVLKEWYRVISPGGWLYVSVPDLDAIARMIVDREQFSAQDRWNLTRMLLGGHADHYDYHNALFNEEILVYFLQQAGFVNIRRGPEVGLFVDTSSKRYGGELISLNLMAEKPRNTDDRQSSVTSVPRGSDVNGVKAPDFREVSFAVIHNGAACQIRYLLDISRLTQYSIAAHILGGKMYEPEISHPLLQVLQTGDCFVDIGANVGYFTVLAAHLVGKDGRVYAFEPEHENFKRLTDNIVLNDLANVTACQAAVGDSTGETELFINSDNDGGHALWNPGAHSFNRLSREKTIRQKTRMLMIDAFEAIVHETRSIKAIKIDVEGYELQVMQGAIQTIVRHQVPFLFVEINRLALTQSGASERALLLFMHHLGYQACLAETAEAGGPINLQEVPLQGMSHLQDPEIVYNVVFYRKAGLEFM